MATTNKRARRAGVLGLLVGCGVAAWMVNHAAAQIGAKPPLPGQPPPAVQPMSPQGGQQLGQLGQQFGSFAQFGQPVVSEADAELRMHFPLESVVERLDYEIKAPAKDAPGSQMTMDTRKRLDALEKAFEIRKPKEGRFAKLMQLHTDRVQQFVNSPGFGFGRMGGPPFNPQPRIQIGSKLTPEMLELPGALPVPFASVRDGGPGANDDNQRKSVAPAPPPARLARLHENGLFDFLDPASFGYVKDRDHVAGFEAHRFRHMPDFAGPSKDEKKLAKEPWAVIRLELMGLLKHKEPMVYVSDVLPSMADVDQAETRPLNSFEEKGLKALREGDDLTTESSGDRIRMVGSLRATMQCVECHQVKRGDLLGAFSWELQRQQADDGK